MALRTSRGPTSFEGADAGGVISRRRMATGTGKGCRRCLGIRPFES